MKYFYILLFCLVTPLFLTSAAQAQLVEWAGKAEGNYSSGGSSFYNGGDDNQLYNISHDGAGNSYLYGSFKDSLKIGGLMYYPTPGATLNSVLAKVSPAGTVVFSKIINTTGQLKTVDMKADAAGNIFLAGTFSGNVNFDGTPLTSTTGNSAFMAKFATTGSLLWVNTTSGSGDASNLYITIDAQNNLLVSGKYSGTVDYFGTSISASGISNAYLAKFNNSGALQWVKSDIASFTYSGIHRGGLKMDTDTNGNIFYLTTGGTYNACDLSVPPASGAGGYILNKLNPAGNCLWSQAADSVRIYADLAVDGFGNCYVSGTIMQTSATIGNTVIPAVTDTDPYIHSSPFLAKYDGNGNVLWAKRYGEAYVGSNKIDADGMGNVYMALGEGYVNSPPTNQIIFDFNLVELSDYMKVSMVVKISPDGNTDWVQKIESLGGYVNGVTVNSISVTDNGALYATGTWYCEEMMCHSGTDLKIGGQTWVTSDTYGSFFFKMTTNANVITGKAFIDDNNNSQPDPAEQPTSELVLEVQPGPSFVSTYPDGTYRAFTGPGTYTVSVAQPPLYHVLTPQSQTATFTGLGNTDTANHFALYPIPNQQDLKVFITPLTPARPGFTTSYRISYSNIGTMAIPTGTVTFTLDLLYNYLSSAPSATQNGQTLTWNFSNLLPGQTHHANVLLSLPINATLGNTIATTATVHPLAGDLTPADNSVSSSRIITSSFDPNSIEVNYQQLTPNQLQSGQQLNYTIRFQNMGTDTAFTVVLLDSLPLMMLNLGTLQLISSSHPCTWNLNQAGRLAVTFNNILLPHQGINNIGSNGFVRFQVKPFSTLAVGDIIPNKAGIYFDFNDPVITNQAITEIVTHSGISSNGKDDWSVFPNPASVAITVASEHSFSGPVEISLLSVLGQQVLKTNASAGNGIFSEMLDLQTVPKGMYTLQIKTETGITSLPLIRQ